MQPNTGKKMLIFSLGGCLYLLLSFLPIIHTSSKALLQQVLIQIFSNKHHARLPLLAFLPRPVGCTLNIMMHALEQEPIVVAIKLQEALHTIQVQTLHRHNRVYEVIDFVHVQGLVYDYAERHHLRVVRT